MIVTEYFVDGTEPEDHCPLHVGRSLFGRLAGWVAGPQAPVSARGAGPVDADEPVAAPAAPAAAPAQAVTEAPEPEKKRGFWSRLFGRKDKKAEKPAPKRQQ